MVLGCEGLSLISPRNRRNAHLRRRLQVVESIPSERQSVSASPRRSCMRSEPTRSFRNIRQAAALRRRRRNEPMARTVASKLLDAGLLASTSHVAKVKLGFPTLLWSDGLRYSTLQQDIVRKSNDSSDCPPTPSPIAQQVAAAFRQLRLPNVPVSPVCPANV
jgi:hypothetical protein